MNELNTYIITFTYDGYDSPSLGAEDRTSMDAYSEDEARELTLELCRENGYMNPKILSVERAMYDEDEWREERRS